MQRQSTPPMRVLDLAARRRGIAREQVGRSHQHAGRADAALRRAVREERRAQALGQAAGPAPSTVSIDAPSACAVGTRQAHTCCAVEQHGAGAAVAGLAADLGAGEAELVAQRVGQRREGRGDSRDRRARSA